MDPIDPVKLDVMARRPATSRRGRGFLAVCGALVLPGLGHVVAGHVWRGMAWFGVWAAACAVMLLLFVTPRFVPGLLFVVPPYLACMLMHLIDAYRMGHRPRREWLFQPHWRYLAGVGIVAVGLLFATLPGPVQLAVSYIRSHFCEAFFVPMASMAPTVGPGDHILVHKGGIIARWDIVAFRMPTGDIHIKRVAGLPGETVMIKDGQVCINGRAVPLPPGVGPIHNTVTGRPLHPTPFLPGSPGPIGPIEYDPATTREVEPEIATADWPMKLSVGEYFVLGDNSSASYDSRYWMSGYPGHPNGALVADAIIGRATWVYWPPTHWRQLSP